MWRSLKGTSIDGRDPLSCSTHLRVTGGTTPSCCSELVMLHGWSCLFPTCVPQEFRLALSGPSHGGIHTSRGSVLPCSQKGCVASSGSGSCRVGKSPLSLTSGAGSRDWQGFCTWLSPLVALVRAKPLFRHWYQLESNRLYSVLACRVPLQIVPP